MATMDPTRMLQMMLSAMLQQGGDAAQPAGFMDDWQADQAGRQQSLGQEVQNLQRQAMTPQPLGPASPGLAVPPMGAAGAAGAVPPPPAALPPIGTGRPMPGAMMGMSGGGMPGGGALGGGPVPIPYPKPVVPEQAAADGQQSGPLDQFMEALGALQPGESDMRPTSPPSAPSQPRGEHAGKMIELLMRMGVIPQTGQPPQQLSQLMRR